MDNPGKQGVDWDDALTKLIDLTVRGQLEWRVEHSFHGRGASDLTGPAFSAWVNDRRVLIYEYRYKSYEDEDTWHWSTDVAVEFVGQGVNLEYQWGGTRGKRWRLLDSIRYRAAGVDEFFSEFLAG